MLALIRISVCFDQLGEEGLLAIGPVPASYEVGLSRREDALEEIQMTFTQLDTFMRP